MWAFPRPDECTSRMVALVALGGVVVITYSVLVAGLCLKILGEREPPFFLVAVMNYGFICYLAPIVWAGTVSWINRPDAPPTGERWEQILESAAMFALAMLWPSHCSRWSSSSTASSVFSNSSGPG